MPLALLLTWVRPTAAQDNKTVEVRLYSSIMPGVNIGNAVTNTQPWCRGIGNALGLHVNIEATHGTTATDLFEFGKSLNDGKNAKGEPVHLGAVWGIEYGWLREKYPELKPLVICYHGSIGFSMHVMAREKDGKAIAKNLRDLKGKRLVVSKKGSLMNQIFLETEVRKVLKPDETVVKFFSSVNACNSLQDAIEQVRDDHADCLVVDIASYHKLMAGKGNVGLAKVTTSSAFPLQVIVGRPDNLRKLSRGLWTKAQSQILKSQHTSDGQMCVGFWGFDRFVGPSDFEAKGFESMLKDRVRTYEASTLTELQLSDLLKRKSQ